jgi:hypothetical protein
LNIAIPENVALFLLFGRRKIMLWLAVKAKVDALSHTESDDIPNGAIWYGQLPATNFNGAKTRLYGNTWQTER